MLSEEITRVAALLEDSPNTGISPDGKAFLARHIRTLITRAATLERVVAFKETIDRVAPPPLVLPEAPKKVTRLSVVQ